MNKTGKLLILFHSAEHRTSYWIIAPGKMKVNKQSGDSEIRPGKKKAALDDKSEQLFF
jgi:hypothetical protein